MAYFDRFQVSAFAARSIFAPLDDLAKRDRWDWTRHVEATLQEARGADGRYYALPCTTDVRLLYWNKDLLQRAGLNAEKGPATWDDLREYAGKLTQRGGPTGITALGFHPYRAQSHFNLFAWQNGGGFQDAAGKRATVNRAENIEALQWNHSLARQQSGGPAVIEFERAQSWSGAQHPFMLNTLAMDLQTNNRLSDIARYRPEMAFGYGAFPLRKAGDKPLSWSGGHSFVIPRGYPDPELAWQFVMFLVSEAGYVAWLDQRRADAAAGGGQYVPNMSTQPALDARMYERYKTGIAAVDQALPFALDLLKSTRIREPSIAAVDLWDAVHGSPDGAQYQAVMLEAKPPKQALDDAQAVAQKALDDAWTNLPKS